MIYPLPRLQRNRKNLLSFCWRRAVMEPFSGLLIRENCRMGLVGGSSTRDLSPEPAGFGEVLQECCLSAQKISVVLCLAGDMQS